jgi:hypothetical protein
MTIYCPRCGEPGRGETIVSVTSVWASCAGCQFVWRSSLLDILVGYARRAFGRARRGQIASIDLQQPPQSLPPVSADCVADWLERQEYVLPEPRVPSTRDAVEDFFVEDDLQFSASAPVHLKPSEEVPQAVDEHQTDDPAENRPATSLEDLHDVFKRLDQQLNAISDSLQTYTPRP